jgi:hypothetical protein
MRNFAKFSYQTREAFKQPPDNNVLGIPFWKRVYKTCKTISIQGAILGFVAKSSAIVSTYVGTVIADNSMGRIIPDGLNGLENNRNLSISKESVEKGDSLITKIHENCIKSTKEKPPRTIKKIKPQSLNGGSETVTWAQMLIHAEQMNKINSESEKRTQKRRADNSINEQSPKKPKIDLIWANAQVKWPMNFIIKSNGEIRETEIMSAQERSRALILMTIVEYVVANNLDCDDNLTLFSAAEKEYQVYKKSQILMEKYIEAILS